MLTVGQEGSSLIEVDCSNAISAVTFGANGQYLVSGDDKGLQVWRVEDGKQMATMEALKVRCVAVSNDGGWIAAGTSKEVVVWDAKTYEKAFVLEEDTIMNGVDFSPNSTRVLIASRDYRATIWDIALATRKRVLTLHHEGAVIAAKFSPQGDRIATATRNSVRVYDSNNGRLLVHIKVKVTPWYNTSLLWSRQQLFVVSDNKIKQINTSTGLIVSEWPVPEGNEFRPIALPMHGEFIAHSTSSIVTFWDTSTQTQLGFIAHAQGILSIALSPNDRFIAIGGKDGKITVKCLSRIIVSIMTLLHDGVSEQPSLFDHIST